MKCWSFLPSRAAPGVSPLPVPGLGSESQAFAPAEMTMIFL